MESDGELRVLPQEAFLERLTAEVARLRDQGHGPIISYSRMVFVPLARLCRNIFATEPRAAHARYAFVPAFQDGDPFR